MSRPIHDPEGERWLEAAGPLPEFEIPGSLAEWEVQRASIREKLWRLLGQIPARPSPSVVRVLSRRDEDGYSVERFECDNGAGARVPGYLLLPAQRLGKFPALLYCHWHGDQYGVGKEELFQANAAPEAPGPALARRGFIVLAIDAYGFGKRDGRGPGGPDENGFEGEQTASKFNLWLGRTLWGMMIRDDLLALDYLESRPEVDRERIGVTGISMGSTRSWWLMALDDRLKTGVGVACLTRYQNLVLDGGLRRHGVYYYVPGMLREFDTEAVISLIAPRPFLFQTGDSDPGSPIDGIRKIDAVVRSIYGLYGCDHAFENRVIEGLGHEYTAAMWQRTMRWFEEKLRSV